MPSLLQAVTPSWDQWLYVSSWAAGGSSPSLFVHPTQPTWLPTLLCHVWTMLSGKAKLPSSKRFALSNDDFTSQHGYVMYEYFTGSTETMLTMCTDVDWIFFTGLLKEALIKYMYKTLCVKVKSAAVKQRKGALLPLYD